MKTFEVEAPDGTVFEIQGDRMPTEAELNNIYSSFKETSGNEGQATSKLEEQFGVNPPPFNLFTKTMATSGFVGPSSEQPGSALPFVGQIIGNAAGAPLGFAGSSGAGILGALTGESARQMIGNLIGVQDTSKSMQQYVKAGKAAAESELAGMATGGLINFALSKAPGVANKLMNSILKPSKNVLKKSPNLGVDAVELGLTGGKDTILNKADDLIDFQENRLQEILNNSDSQVNLGGLKIKLNSLVDEMIDKTDKNAVKEVLNDILDAAGKKDVLGVSEANQLKRRIYSKLKESSYGTSQVPAKTNAYKTAGSYFRKSIEGALPDEPIGEINRSIQVAGRVRNAMQDVIANSQKKNAIGISDILYGLVGANVFKNPLGLALPLASRTAGSSVVKSSLASLLANKTSQEFFKDGSKSVAPIIKSSLSGVFRENV